MPMIANTNTTKAPTKKLGIIGLAVSTENALSPTIMDATMDKYL